MLPAPSRLRRFPGVRLPLAVELRRGHRPFGSLELAGLAGLLAAAVALAWPALPWLQALWPGCAFRDWTGLPCGACGFTRAFVRVAALDVGGAISVSPLGAVLLPAWTAIGLVVLATWALPGLPLPVLVARGPAGSLLLRWGFLALLLANWAYLVVFTLLTGAAPA